VLITMKFTDEDSREKRVFDLGDEGGKIQCAVFYDDEPVEAAVNIRIPAGQSLDHSGITCELIGVVGEMRVSRVLEIAGCSFSRMQRMQAGASHCEGLLACCRRPIAQARMIGHE